MMIARCGAWGVGLTLAVTLLGAWPVAAQDSDSVPASGFIPGIGAVPTAKNISAFTAPVILPPSGLHPLAALPVMQPLMFTVATNAGPGANYLMILGNGSGDYGAEVFAIIGPDQSGQDEEVCDPSLSYCNGATMRGYRYETFAGLEIRGVADGYVSHTITNNQGTNEFWDANWYDPTASASYRLTVFAPFCSAYGPLGAFDESNQDGAQNLVQLANQLAVWNGQ